MAQDRSHELHVRLPICDRVQSPCRSFSEKLEYGLPTATCCYLHLKDSWPRASRCVAECQSRAMPPCTLIALDAVGTSSGKAHPQLAHASSLES